MFHVKHYRLKKHTKDVMRMALFWDAFAQKEQQQ